MNKIKNLEEALGRTVTPKQKEIFMVIDSWWAKFGFGPSVDDIMRLTGDKGRGNVNRVCNKLVELGICKKVKGRARSIRPVYINFRNIQ
jgi:SOS-response transcriptional repressor LexA